MAEMDFFTKCEKADFEKILANKGYAYFTNGAYNLNIIGVRSNQEKKVTNIFDDALVLIYYTKQKRILKRHVYRITTEPGTHYMLHPMNEKKGTAILVPGQYRSCWEIGKHNGKYKALVQKKAVFVYRDNNKDMTYDLKPEKTEVGVFGINIHRSAEFSSSAFVNKFSAGCQVFANPNSFKSFMEFCELQVANKKGKTFTYTLLEESDLTIMLK